MAILPSWWEPAVREFERRADALGTESLRVTMTSWGRTIRKNAAVGGAARSQHLVWTAADFAGPDQAIVKRRALSVGLIAIDEGDHVHVQLFPAGRLDPRIFAAVARA